MDRHFRDRFTAREPDAQPPSEAWLSGQALVGKRVPTASSARSIAGAKREQLEWLASISTEHAAELRRLKSAEAKARHDRELLIWLASISEEHNRKLRA